ncbi:MAG: hypothetical protein H6970_15460 [Gammaproteobacteria bacterium]|nr:hypothetical protein [Gammaproteobacteria bacterium]
MDGLLKIFGCDNAERLADIIFVHGLDGDARTTWRPKDNPQAFWPAWLAEEIPQIGVWSLGYAVSSSAWKGQTMPLADRATNSLDILELDGIGRRPVVFIGHSLGGLLIKQMLRHACDYGNPAWQTIATQTKAIVFLSTPHSGADLASWIKYIGGLLRTTITVEELEAHHPRLRELNLWYRNYVADSNIKTVVYCESEPVAGLRVVNETTADPGIAGVIPIPVPEDHVSICKPASKDSQIYRRVRQLVADIATELRTPPDRSPATDIGRIKLDICRRLGADWQNLADFFEIPPAERERFDKGWEPQRVWEWLERRVELARLAEGLRYIGREDIAELADRPL